MIKKIFNRGILNSKPSSSIISAAFVITMAALASRFLGLIRDSFLAATFSAGDTLDTYYAAFRIPDLIYNLLILGALSAAFIPVFTSLVSREKKEEAWEMANGIVNLSIFFILILSLIFAIFAPYLMRIITPGFAPDKLAKTIMLTRIMFLSPLFLGISGIFGGILNSFKRFLIYSIAPLFYNLGIIIGVLVFVPFLGPVGLAWGVVFGAMMHMLIQYPAAKHLGYRHNWKFLVHFSNREVRKVVRLMIPRTLGIAVNQINLFIITIFASILASGSLAIMNLAQNLQGVPVGIFGSSFAIAVFPTLAAAYAREDHSEFIQHFSQTFRRILFFVVPSTIFILLLRAQIVRVILGHGKFDWEDTVLTFQALGIFSISLFAQCLIPLLARAFYSMHDTKTPFYIALVTEAINFLAVITLIRHFQVIGLAIAFTLANIVQMFILLFFLRSRLNNLDDRNILKSLSKILFASALAGVGIQLTKYLVSSHFNIDTFVGIFMQLAAASFVGFVIFIVSCQLMRVEEYIEFKNSISRRVWSKIWGGKKEITEDFSDVSGI